MADDRGDGRRRRRRVDLGVDGSTVVPDTRTASADVEILEQRDIDDAENGLPALEHRYRRREGGKSRLKVVRPVEGVDEPLVGAVPLVIARFLGAERMIGKPRADHLEHPLLRAGVGAGFYVVGEPIDVRVAGTVRLAEVSSTDGAGLDRGRLEFREGRLHGSNESASRQLNVRVRLARETSSRHPRRAGTGREDVRFRITGSSRSLAIEGR